VTLPLNAVGKGKGVDGKKSYAPTRGGKRPRKKKKGEKRETKNDMRGGERAK